MTVLWHLVVLHHVSYVLFDRSSLICLSVQFSLPHIQSHRATTLAHGSTARTSSTDSTYTAYGELSMHRHVLIALFCFQLPTLANTISRGHVFVAGVVVETIGPLSPNTARGLLNNFSAASDRKMQIADHVRRAHNVNNSHRNSIPNPNHPYQHHCERCCDYHPVRSHSTDVMALFVFVIVQPP